MRFSTIITRSPSRTGCFCVGTHRHLLVGCAGCDKHWTYEHDGIHGEPVSATTLLWSHAEFVLAVTEYIGKYQELLASQRIEWRL